MNLKQYLNPLRLQTAFLHALAWLTAGLALFHVGIHLPAIPTVVVVAISVAASAALEVAYLVFGPHRVEAYAAHLDAAVERIVSEVKVSASTIPPGLVQAVRDELLGALSRSRATKGTSKQAAAPKPAAASPPATGGATAAK